LTSRSATFDVTLGDEGVPIALTVDMPHASGTFERAERHELQSRAPGTGRDRERNRTYRGFLYL